MKKVLFLIFFVVFSSVCFGGSIISLSMTKSSFSVPCCEFNFDPIPEGGSAIGQFAIKNVSTSAPITYSLSVNSPFKIGVIGIAPAPSINNTLSQGASVTVSVFLNNAPAGFQGTSPLKIHATRLGTSEDIPGWFVAARVVRKLPDLTIAITRVAPPVPSQGNKNQVTMDVAVTNKGFENGPAPQIQIAVDGRVETTFQFVSVSVGQTVSQSNIQFLTSASGPNHKITATVDSGHIVTEFDETNNTAQITKDFP